MLLVGVYVVLGVLAAPGVALLVALHPALREHARERLGFPVVELEPGPLWLHAASLGERRVVDALLPELRRAHPDVELLLTCTSAASRERTAGPDQVLALPVDVLPAVLAFLDRVRPRALVLVEAELWPALVLGCRLRGVPVLRLAPREGPGMRRLRRLPGVEAALVGGLPCIEPGQDLKAAAPRPARPFRWSGPALVAGSTRAGEEEAVLDAWAGLSPRPLLLLAPREPARFGEVAAVLAARGVRAARRTGLGAEVPPGVEVVLLDTLGELAGVYPYAHAAFVGGTLVEAVGGHSPAEAAAAGCVLVRGPHVHANAPAWAAVPALVAPDAAGLADALRAAFAAPRRAEAGPPALGAVLDALAPALAAPPAPERALRPWLWPLAAVWLLAASARPAALRKAALPVVSVGGLTAGGSGKTPVAAWIAERLPGSVVVARGYGRRRGGEVRREGGAAELGDELCMLARRGQAVASCPDRAAAIAEAGRAGARVAVLDDGFSARGVGRDLEVVVLDARWPDGGGPIPVGTRRVPRRWLARADVLWCNHGPPPAWARRALRPGATVVQARLVPTGWVYRGELRPLDALPRRPCVAMAGIARPEGFFRALRGLALDLRECRVFADHHAFGWRDLQAIEAWKDDHNVLVTEKDAARLPEGLGVWALRVEVQIVEGEAALRSRLAPFGLREPAAAP